MPVWADRLLGPAARLAAEHGVAMHDIEPSKPDQNAYIERFSWSYRIRAPVEAPRQCRLRTVPSNPPQQTGARSRC